MGAMRSARLLPWSGPEGKPCYLIGEEGGPVSRVADAMESVQLAMGRELLGHARALLADTDAGASDADAASQREVRYLAARLSEALADALRIAESRGSRI